MTAFSIRHLTCVVQTTRPPFLPLAVLCVALGAALAHHLGTPLRLDRLILIATAALCAHASVNQFNEYADFHSRLDFHTRRTPFSGGSGALPGFPPAGIAVLMTATALLVLTIGIGFSLALEAPLLWPLGITGVLIVVSYTPWLNRQAWLCLLAPGTGFGAIIVAGSYLALGGNPVDSTLAIIWVPFALVNNLLLMNQYPDMSVDRAHGRRHFPIRYGLPASNLVYGFFMLTSASLILSMVQRDCLPTAALLALAPLALSLPALAIVIREGVQSSRLRTALALNVAAVLGTIATLSIALLL